MPYFFCIKGSGSMKMQISGIGIAGSWGDTLESAYNLFSDNNSKPNASVEVKADEDEFQFPFFGTDTSSLKDFLPSGKLRRVNKFSRMAALAAVRALQDTGIYLPVDNPGVGMVIASGYGASTSTFDFLYDVITEGDIFASPTKFSNSLHSVAASNISILFDIKGPVVTVTQFEMSAISALLSAWHMLTYDNVDAVLVGVVEECNDVLGYCYKRYWNNSDQPAVIEPANIDTQSAIPGEGAAFLVLTKKEVKGSKYGSLTDIEWSAADSQQEFADESIIVNMDGHKRCGRYYNKLLNGISKDKIITFSPYTGSMPVGQFFDLILGVLASKNNLISSDFISLKAGPKGDLGIIKYLHE